MRVVVSQSMLFPWVGMLEQVRLADVFVHYDDVQFSKGSYVNRVQVKTSQGVQWMTVPLRDIHLGQTIDEVTIAPMSQWRDKHLDLLARSFEGAPFASEAVELARSVYAVEHTHLGPLARASLMAVIRYFGLDEGRHFVDVKTTGIDGKSNDRVIAVARHFDAHEYITGHGAANYLDHERFEQAGIAVSYMEYRRLPYAQLHGDFTPYVSSLDLVANLGRQGVHQICSETVGWREFLRTRRE
jgi:hypothetical protein